MIILLDAGHGSNTKGKRSPDGRLMEYAWAREIVNRLALRLEAMGHNTQIVVPEDWDVSITERVKRINSVCNTVGASNVLLVSVHNNAGGCGQWGPQSGFSVYVSKNASMRSKKCASIFTEEAMARKMTGNRSVPLCKYWTWSWTTADIGILKRSNCPAVLTENFFMDNLEDCNYLLSEEGKEAIADLHATCIDKYIESL